MAADYFEDDGGIKMPSFVKNIFKTSSSKKILTVGHLEKGIIAGQLNEKIINS